MVIEDWKTAQNIFVDDDDHVEFKVLLNGDNIQFNQLPIEYETNIASFKESVEAQPPTSFDDLMPFREIECLEFETMPYSKFEIPQMSNY